MPRDLADIFAGPDPSDSPADAAGLALLDELERAAAALAQRLRHEPGLSREAARVICKLQTAAPGIAFRGIIWPRARLLAGLPAKAKAGRPVGARTRKKSGTEIGR